MLLFLFGIAIAGAMLWSLIPRRDKFEAPGMLIERAAYPRLFSEIDSIAAALNEPWCLAQALPDREERERLRCGPGGMLGFGSRRIMGLAPSVALNDDRVALPAALAHGSPTTMAVIPASALGYTGRSLPSSARLKISDQLGQMARIAILGLMYTFVATLLKWYFIAFLRIIEHCFAKTGVRSGADQLASIVAGKQNLIDGLAGDSYWTAAVWPAYWKQEVAPILGDGSLVAVGDGLNRFMSVPRISGGGW